jgi:Protein of unknown function (DUF2752)
MTRATFCQPMLAAILRDRRLGSIICGAGLLQLLLTFLGVPGWTCPIFHTFGIPCPGCGMTRATLFLFRGDLKQALTMHVYAPILLIALIIITLCTIGPRNYVERIVAKTETLENYTGITTILLGGLIVYWLARLLILQTAFVRLIQG